jgi:hypothetical protein
MHELNQAHRYHTIYIISLLISCMDDSYTTTQEFCIANHNANKFMPIIGLEVIIDIHLALDERLTLSRNNLSSYKYLLTSQIVWHFNVHVKWTLLIFPLDKYLLTSQIVWHLNVQLKQTICKHLTITNLPNKELDNAIDVNVIGLLYIRVITKWVRCNWN